MAGSKINADLKRLNLISISDAETIDTVSFRYKWKRHATSPKVAGKRWEVVESAAVFQTQKGPGNDFQQ